MQTVTISPGTVGADYTGFTPAIEAWLSARRARFVVRYIAAGGSWKHVTPAELATLHRKGIAVVLNSEGSTSDYTGGAARGRLYGANARIAAQRLGYPTGLPLVVSVDTGLTAAQLPLAKAYVEAFFAAARPYRPALYGPVNLLHVVSGYSPLYWLPNATSWQTGLRPSDRVHVRQQRALVPPGVDPNTAVTPFDAWLPTPDPDPDPPPTDIALGALMNSDVLFCYIDANGTAWVGNGFVRQALDGDQFAQRLLLSSTGGGPVLVTANGVQVTGIDMVAKVGPATIEALGKAV